MTDKGPCRFCGDPAVGFYIIGLCCARHTPAASAGHPEPRPPARAQEEPRAQDPARAPRAYGTEVRVGSKVLPEPAARVWTILQDGSWHTVAELARDTENRPDEVTGWLKEFQTPIYGAQDFQKRRAPGPAGEWELRLAPA